MNYRNVGGTSGGLGSFLFGLAMAVAGGYMLTSRVSVSTGGWYLWGYSSFGVSLIPFVIGTGLVFFDGKSRLGWAVVFLLVIILAGVLLNLNIYFQHTTLFETLVMVGLIAGGVGLIARSTLPS